MKRLLPSRQPNNLFKRLVELCPYRPVLQLSIGSAMISLAVARSAALSSDRVCALADGLIYLRDTCTTLAALAEVYPPAAGLFLQDAGGLLPQLPLLHDKLLPDAIKAWSAIRLQPTNAALCLKVRGSLLCLAATLRAVLYWQGAQAVN